MNLEYFTALALFCFVSSATPGPNNLMLMASGANYGFKRSLPHMLGISIGFTLMVILVGVGLMQVFDAFPITYQLLKWFSVAYLLYLAWKIANAQPPKATDSNEESSASKPFTFIQAALFQWVNPKAWTMALTAITVYSSDRSFGSVTIVAVVFGLVNFPSVSLWTLLGQQVSRLLKNPVRLKVFNISMALMLVGSLYPVLF
jgi:threonine/homoserine/homoserine lactone efflux protein